MRAASLFGTEEIVVRAKLRRGVDLLSAERSQEDTDATDNAEVPDAEVAKIEGAKALATEAEGWAAPKAMADV